MVFQQAGGLTALLIYERQRIKVLIIIFKWFNNGNVGEAYSK